MTTALTEPDVTAAHSRSLSAVVWAWAAFGALIGAAWWALIAQHLSGNPQAHHGTGAGLLSVVAMWMLMAVAMMAPTATPMLGALRSVLRSTSMRPWWAFLGAYLLMWLVFSVVVALAQFGLMHIGLVRADGAVASYWTSGVLLIGAGTYQFTTLKQRCQTECSSPMTFFFRFWRDGVRGGALMGVRHGATCLGCCWALMLLAFVGGVNNIWLMVLGAALMALEKLPGIGSRITLPLGAVLVAAGACLLVAAFIGSGGPATNHLHSLSAIYTTKGSPWNPGPFMVN